jgi:hypothetical protein
METIYKVARIDVHKKMLAVVITDAAQTVNSGLSAANSAPERATWSSSVTGWPGRA